jgi:hypothetical protein
MADGINSVFKRLIEHGMYKYTGKITYGATVHIGPGLFNVEASRLYSDTLYSVETVWTSDQPDAETST